jgi:beta-lactamase superfamily II metal-dependent hydrolase
MATAIFRSGLPGGVPAIHSSTKILYAMPPAKKYVGADTTPLYASPDVSDNKKVTLLLWGDQVQPVGTSTGERIKVKGRGRTGYVRKTDLGNERLLELYFIDVGQGDGILIRTPGGKHILIDGGYKRKAQPSGKNAADFVDWKFARDYGMDSIELDAMIASHNDADHYGGLWDLLNPQEQAELDIDAARVRVKKFYHAGVAWFSKNGKRSLGPIVDKKLVLLAEDHDDIADLLANGRDGYVLQGEWAKFMQCIVDKQIPAARISNQTGTLTDFDEPGFRINVLSPIEDDHQGEPAYALLGSASDHAQNTNGHSITLRLDYKSTRMLLTGDLNARSQQLILQHYAEADDLNALACDVAKSCHHGSDDCSFEFLSQLSPGATVISSGDAEGHGHPRPSIVAASAMTGHRQLLNDHVITPLIYSTEISRSYKLGTPEKLTLTDVPQDLDSSTNLRVTYKEVSAGDLQPSTRTRPFWGRKIVGGIIYGLVNVRTDGKTILCATLSEKSGEWEIKKFKSRF